MSSLQYTSLESIMTSTNRVKFTENDGQYIMSLLKHFAQKGRFFNPHPMMTGSVQEILDDGLVVFRADDLDTDFVLVKINAGRGLLGGQKSRVMTYVGQISENELMPSVQCKNVATALVSVDSVYRSQGL